MIGLMRRGEGPRPGDEELAALVEAYRSLRGGEPRVRRAGTWGWFAEFPDADAGPDAEGGEGSAWTIVVGAAHADGPLGETPLPELDGTFVAVRYAPERDQVEVLNDRLGMQHLYLAQRAGQTYVSTSATALARHLHAPADPLGARLFLRTGQQFGPVTHWRGIERAEPATLLSCGPRGEERGTYWRPVVDGRVRAMGLDQVADHFAEVALATVQRRLGDAPCLWADLTGGYDSRLITVLLAKLGIPFRANTAGEEETADVAVAREVARAGGFAWRQERLPGDWRLDPALVHEAVAWSDATLDALLLGEVLWRQAERSRTCRTVVNGAGGGHLNPYPWLQEFLRAGRSREVNVENLMRMRVLPPGGGQRLLRAEPADSVEAYCRRVLGARMAPYAHELNTTQLDLAHGYKSVGHFGAFRSAYESHVRTEMPLYYRDIFSVAFSVHHRWRNGHRLHRAVTERLNPRVAALMTEHGGPAELARPGNLHRFLPYYTRLARTAVRKVRGRPAPATRTPPVTSHGYRHAVDHLRDDGVLEPHDMRSAALYAPDALARLSADAASPGFDDWGVLGRVIALELILRKVDGAGF